MMKSKYQFIKDAKENNETAKRCLILYKQGLPLRQIGKVVDKSHEWVRKALHTLSIDKN